MTLDALLLARVAVALCGARGRGDVVRAKHECLYAANEADRRRMAAIRIYSGFADDDRFKARALEAAIASPALRKRQPRRPLNRDAPARVASNADHGVESLGEFVWARAWHTRQLESNPR